MNRPNPAVPAPRRLDFELPPFLREAWVSDAAAQAWSGRLRELSLALLDAAIIALADHGGVSRRRIPGWQVFRARAAARRAGLGHRIETVHCGDDDRPGLLYYDVTIGPELELVALDELTKIDPSAVADRIGLPACCAAAAAMPERLVWNEPLWPAALATPDAQISADVVSLAGPPELNPLLWRLGLRVNAHLPCQLACTASRQQARAIIDAGLAGPQAAAIRQLLEVLSWPCEWSVLHGIAELKTPVARYATVADATAGRHAVRWLGTGYPDEGATGLNFPYRSARCTPLTRSRSFQRALAEPIAGAPDPATLRLADPALPVPRRYTDSAIDWTRLAEPQDDGYDTETALKLSTREPRQPAGTPAICDGRVAVRASAPEFLGRMGWTQGPLVHPHIDQAAAWLDAWPTVLEQFCQLVEVLHPVNDPKVPETQWGQALGSQSHNVFTERGHIYATVFDPLGLAQAMVHEMAHTKLYDLGLPIESAHHLILNPLDQTFASPVRTDRGRPMSAVFHGVYAFIHVLELDLRLWRRIDDGPLRERLKTLMARNVTRMEQGLAILREHGRYDARGERFVGAFQVWAQRVVKAGKAVLEPG